MFFIIVTVIAQDAEVRIVFFICFLIVISLLCLWIFIQRKKRERLINKSKVKKNGDKKETIGANNNVENPETKKIEDINKQDLETKEKISKVEKNIKEDKKEMIEKKKVCRSCGFSGYPKNNIADIRRCFLSVSPALVAAIFYPSVFLVSIVISIVLYTIILNKRETCPSCNAQNTMIDITSPKGKEIYLKHNDETNYQKEINQITQETKQNKINYIFIALILLSFVISIIIPPIKEGYNEAAERDRIYQQQQYERQAEKRQNMEELGATLGAIGGGIVGYIAGTFVGDFGGAIGAPSGAALGKALGKMAGNYIADNQ